MGESALESALVPGLPVVPNTSDRSDDPCRHYYTDLDSLIDLADLATIDGTEWESQA